jgi:hypothetical protein
VKRLLNVLVVCDVVREADVDRYTHTPFSATLVDDHGLINGINHFYDVAVHHTANLPSYLQANSYKSPASASDLPWESLMPDGGSSLWDFYSANPEAGSHFQDFLSCILGGNPPWPEYHSIFEDLMSGYDPSTTLCVDVGGGLGQDLVQLHNALQSTPNASAPLILQDLESVISSPPISNLPSTIKPHKYNKNHKSTTSSPLNPSKEHELISSIQFCMIGLIPRLSKFCRRLRMRRSLGIQRF